jgi:hypothetical protein
MFRMSPEKQRLLEDEFPGSMDITYTGKLMPNLHPILDEVTKFAVPYNRNMQSDVIGYKESISCMRGIRTILPKETTLDEEIGMKKMDTGLYAYRNNFRNADRDSNVTLLHYAHRVTPEQIAELCVIYKRVYSVELLVPEGRKAYFGGEVITLREGNDVKIQVDGAPEVYVTNNMWTQRSKSVRISVFRRENTQLEVGEYRLSWQTYTISKNVIRNQFFLTRVKELGDNELPPEPVISIKPADADVQQMLSKITGAPVFRDDDNYIVRIPGRTEFKLPVNVLLGMVNHFNGKYYDTIFWRTIPAVLCRYTKHSGLSPAEQITLLTNEEVIRQFLNEFLQVNANSRSRDMTRTSYMKYERINRTLRYGATFWNLRSVLIMIAAFVLVAFVTSLAVSYCFDESAPFRIILFVLRKMSGMTGMTLFSIGCGMYKRGKRETYRNIGLALAMLAILGEFSWTKVVVLSVLLFRDNRVALYAYFVSVLPRAHTASAIINLHTPQQYRVIIMILFFLLAMTYIAFKHCYSSYKDRFKNWLEHKSSVESRRMTLRTSGQIGPTFDDCIIRDFETKIDLTKYPSHPKAKLVQTEDLLQLENKPACIATGIVFCDKAPLVHSTSQKNLIAALTTRSILFMPAGDSSYWALLSATMEGSLANIQDVGGYPDYCGPEFRTCGVDVKPHGRVSWEEYLKRFPGPKQRKFTDWKEKHSRGCVTPQQINYGAFVKRDKIMGIGMNEFSPVRPRVIQAMSEPGKILSGPWFLNYSYALKGAWNPFNRIWYCSGYTTDVYNAWINKIVKEFGGYENCIFLGTDFSTYDVTQGEHCMNREYEWYKSLGFMKYVSFGKYILMLKKKYTGYGKGVKYSMVFCRKSGENDTSSGNSKNTGESIGAYFMLLGVDFRMAVLGDDNFIVVRAKTLKQSLSSMVNGLEEWITNLGYKLKVQYSVGKPWVVEFLSSRFYPVGGVLRLGKKPGRVLVKIGWFLYRNNIKDMATYTQYLKGSLVSLAPVANHVPFLRTYCKVVLDYLKEIQPLYNIEESMYKMFTSGSIFEPQDDTFVAFQEVYGLDHQNELEFEKELKACVRKMPYLMNSPFIDSMLAVDEAM